MENKQILNTWKITHRAPGEQVDSKHRKQADFAGDSNPGPFDHESGALTTELFPLPIMDKTLSSSCCDTKLML